MDQIACPNCGKTIDVEDSHPGQTVVCPNCADIFEVKDEEYAASGAAWDNPVDQVEDSLLESFAEAGPPAVTAAGRGGWRLVAYCLVVSILLLGMAFAVMWGGRYFRFSEIAEPQSPTARPTTLDGWIRQLDRGPTPEARREAARAIVAAGPEAVVAALDATTDIPDQGNTLAISPAVVRAMADQGTAAAAALGEALASEKTDVRAAAARMLEEMGPDAKGAAAAITAALNDRNHWVRWFSIDSLGNMGPAAAPAVDALLPLLKHADHNTRRRAATALGHIGAGAQGAVSALTETRQSDDDQSVRKAAGTALQRINSAEAVP